MKKILLLLLSAIFVLFGCSSGEEAESTGGCTEDQALQVLSSVHLKSPDETEAWNTYVSEQLGFPVEITYMTDGYSDYVASAFETDMCYDVIYTTNSKFMNDQYAMPLDDIIADSEVLSDPNTIPPQYYEDARQYSQQEATYIIPNKQEGDIVLFYRQDWLEEWNMEVPTTMDEWYEYMKKANEEYGAYGFATNDKLFDIQTFMSQYGLQYGFVKDESGMWTVPYTSDEAIPVYEWLHKLYVDGLLDPNFLTQGDSENKDAFMAGELATVPYWSTWVGLMNDMIPDTSTDPAMDGFVAAGAPPCLDENGNGYIRKAEPGGWFINKNTQKVDESVAFIEYMYSDAGILLTSAGIPGYDYEIDENGTIVFTDKGTEHSGDHGAPMTVDPDYEKPYSEFPLEGAAEAVEVNEPYAFMTVGNSAGDWSTIESDIIGKYGCQIILGEITAEEGVQKMQEEVQPFLDEMNGV